MGTCQPCHCPGSPGATTLAPHSGHNLEGMGGRTLGKVPPQGTEVSSHVPTDRDPSLKSSPMSHHPSRPHCRSHCLFLTTSPRAAAQQLLCPPAFHISSLSLFNNPSFLPSPWKQPPANPSPLGSGPRQTPR